MTEPIFLKEIAYYSYESLQQKTKFTDSEMMRFRERLLEKGLAKSSPKKDYIFNYVGLLYFQQKLMYVLPKYINMDEAEDLYNKAKQLTSVMLKYSRDFNVHEETINTYGNIKDEQFSDEIVLADYFIKDYMDNGVYLYSKHEESINGNGEIDWYLTIEQSQMFLFNDRPLYLDVFTNDQEIDYLHPLHLLHKAILTEVSQLLERFNELGIFQYERIAYPDEISELGDRDYLLYLIESELQIEFADRKVQLLQAMKKYLLNNFSNLNEDNLQLFGVRKFDVIWEKVCGDVYGNQYELFCDYIPKPIWEDFNTRAPVDRATLVPDILVYKPEYKSFFILDAKYYLTVFKNKNEKTVTIEDNPGIGDVTKQYLYEQALRKNNSIVRESDCYNIFIMPSEQDNAFFGKVTIDVFSEDLKGIYLYRQNIDKVFEAYLNKEKKDLESMKAFIDQKEHDNKDS